MSPLALLAVVALLPVAAQPAGTAGSHGAQPHAGLSAGLIATRDTPTSAPAQATRERTAGSETFNATVVGIAPDASGGGYWEVTADGGVFSFGNASFHGSMGGQPLDAPIVGISADPATGGYWEVASDGGIFAFDAPFHGSMGGHPLNNPIVGMSADPATGGYWEVASDGGIFAFDAPFLGSMGGHPLDAPITGIASTPNSEGYWEAGADGGVFTFGQAQFSGSAFSGSATAASTRFYLPPANPPSNIPPNPQYTATPSSSGSALAAIDPPCWQIAASGWVPTPSAAQCLTAEIEATNGARATEGLGPMQLPTNFASLTPQEQLLVVSDIERVSRGEQPITGLSSLLDGYAQQGTESNSDPQFDFAALPSSDWWGSNWASGMLNALDANYTWMYDDGYGGYNIDCTSPGAAGCWAHRDNILTSNYGGTLIMGAGYVADSNGFSSLSELFVVVADPADVPPLYYTWSDALAAGAAA